MDDAFERETASGGENCSAKGDRTVTSNFSKRQGARKTLNRTRNALG